MDNKSANIHFLDLGEKVTQLEINAAKKSTEEDKDVIVLVNDVGLVENLATYLLKGIEGVIENYQKRSSSCATDCVSSQIPVDDEIPKVANESQYQVAAHYINSKYKIKSKKQAKKVIQKEFAVLREMLAGRLVDELGLENPSIYFETDFQNIVLDRTCENPDNPKHSWITQVPGVRRQGKEVYLGSQKLVNWRGHAMCRGIIPAFIEELAMLGYDDISKIATPDKYPSLVKGQLMFELMQPDLAQVAVARFNVNYRWIQ